MVKVRRLQGRLCAVRKWCAHSLVVSEYKPGCCVLRGGESRCRYGELIDAGRKRGDAIARFIAGGASSFPSGPVWATTSALTMTAPVASRTVPTMREVVWVSPGLKCCASGRVLALHLGDGGRVSHRATILLTVTVHSFRHESQDSRLKQLTRIGCWHMPGEPSFRPSWRCRTSRSIWHASARRGRTWKD